LLKYFYYYLILRILLFAALSGFRKYNRIHGSAMRTLIPRSHCCINCLKIPTVIVIGRQLRISFQKQRTPRTASPNIRTRCGVLLKDECDGNESLPSLFWLSHVSKTNLTEWSVYRIVPCDKSCFLTNAILRERSHPDLFSHAAFFPFK